jgi:hypothetical protein
MVHPVSVEDYTRDHPFKLEVQAVREVVLAVDPRITKLVTWNARPFSYQGNTRTR